MRCRTWRGTSTLPSNAVGLSASSSTASGASPPTPGQHPRPRPSRTSSPPQATASDRLEFRLLAPCDQRGVGPHHSKSRGPGSPVHAAPQQRRRVTYTERPGTLGADLPRRTAIPYTASACWRPRSGTLGPGTLAVSTTATHCTRRAPPSTPSAARTPERRLPRPGPDIQRPLFQECWIPGTGTPPTASPPRAKPPAPDSNPAPHPVRHPRRTRPGTTRLRAGRDRLDALSRTTRTTRTLAVCTSWRSGARAGSPRPSSRYELRERRHSSTGRPKPHTLLGIGLATD